MGYRTWASLGPGPFGATFAARVNVCPTKASPAGPRPGHDSGPGDWLVLPLYGSFTRDSLLTCPGPLSVP